MLFIEEQEVVIRNAIFIDNETIVLSTDKGKIYKYKYNPELEIHSLRQPEIQPTMEIEDDEEDI